MASRKTQHYNLSLWDETDPIQREDFNADHVILDTALGQMTKIAAGSYTGTGTAGVNGANELDFADSLGQTPAFVVVMDNSCIRQLLMVRGMTQKKSFNGSTNVDHTCKLEWTDTGVRWYNTASNTGAQMNDSGSPYFFVAFA